MECVDLVTHLIDSKTGWLIRSTCQAATSVNGHVDNAIRFDIKDSAKP